ncbi:MAG: right-handed parallel beta-helix repeat-containing protein [Candidatus Odinarchaeota archaeon]|nr:right-handed parallel beta-helix repeat-containing protein [Candidatus Odinarchaeota archaeon]
MRKKEFHHFIILSFFIVAIIFSNFELPLFLSVENGSNFYENVRKMEFEAKLAEDSLESLDIYRTTVIVKNQVLNISGTLRIHDNGTLILINSTLKMDTRFIKSNIIVFNSGNLTLINSTVTSLAPHFHYCIRVTNESALYIKNSQISYVCIEILNDSSLLINDSKISYAGYKAPPVSQSEQQHLTNLNNSEILSSPTYHITQNALYVMESSVTIAYSTFQDIELGLVFYRIRNCKVINNTFSGGEFFGISESDGCVVTNNTLTSADIWILNTNNTNVTDNMVIGGKIKVKDSVNIHVARNLVYTSRGIGIYIYKRVPGMCVIKDNKLIKCGFFIDGEKQALTGVLLEGNMINNKPLTFIFNASNRKYTFKNSVGQVIVIYSENITIQNTQLSDTSDAILVINSANLLLTDNTVTNNGIGISFWTSANCEIRDSSITNNEWGIYLVKSINNTIAGNLIRNNSYGIYLKKAQNTKIIGNVIQENRYGIHLYYVTNTTIENNTFIDNIEDIYELPRDEEASNLFTYLGFLLFGITITGVFIIVIVVYVKYKRKILSKLSHRRR